MILRGIVCPDIFSSHPFGCYYAMVVINIILSIEAVIYLLNISMHNQSASCKVSVGGVLILYGLLDCNTCNQTKTPDLFA